jgi:hypothetical protein
MTYTVTLFSQDDITLMFQVGLWLLYGSLAMFVISGVSAIRRSYARVRRPRR